MTTSRLEAFSDGVIAILITIMVLELKVPEGTDWSALSETAPTLLAYVLSFVYLGICWNNHHHLLTATKSVTGAALWANLHLLFWLSLVPFTTSWMSEHHFPAVPTTVYGMVLLAAAVAFFVLQTTLLRSAGRDSSLARALGSDLKGKASPVLYVIGIACSLVLPALGLAFYVRVALMWLVPDRRIERLITAR